MSESSEAARRIPAACRMGVWGAASTLFGILASGPLSLVTISAIHPQPPWAGADLFARHFHALQTFPFFVGFFLVGGYVVLIASLHTLASPEHRARATSGLVFTGAFAALVFFNYIVQTTLIPNLVRNYAPENATIISTFSMANPTALGWAIEMWAYGLLGVATWLVAPVLCESPLERLAAKLFVANGVVSVLTAIWTAVEPGWVMKTYGLIAFTIWNLLVCVMSALTVVALRRRATAFGPANVPGIA